MPVMRECWNDDKMDALAEKVDDLERRTGERFDRLYECLIQANLAAIVVLTLVLVAFHR
jgi:hypothetical protein